MTTHEKLIDLQPTKELRRKAVKALRKGRRGGKNGYDLATQEDRDLNYRRYHKVG